jgi:hypothetical protein
MAAEKAERRPAHRTQWAAQFAVASELCKRGFEVAFTTGNHPSVDLMVRSPKKGVTFGVDVKGLYRQNFWVVKSKPFHDGLFYVLAYVPDGDRNRYFILNQMQVNAEVAAEFERARLRAQSKGRTDEKAGLFPGVGWKFAEQYEEAWGSLPA